MVGPKLVKKLKQEIDHYIDLPYMTNIIRNGKVIKERVLGGKGYWKDIQKETQQIAKQQGINLKKLTRQKFYNFQKKNKIGIDCSGLACQLLNFYFKAHLNPRKTSANILTSTPLSQRVDDFQNIQTGDLIRQKNGHHLLFIIEKNGNKITYVDSSFWGRGVKYGETDITDQSLDNQGVYRLLLLN